MACTSHLISLIKPMDHPISLIKPMDHLISLIKPMDHLISLIKPMDHPISLIKLMDHLSAESRGSPSKRSVAITWLSTSFNCASTEPSTSPTCAGRRRERRRSE